MINEVHHKGGAPKGNEFWKKRAKHGRDKIFSNPDILLEAATEYFIYENKQVQWRNEAIKGGEFAGTTVAVATNTPFTFQGLCIFLHVNTKYFNHFETGIKTTKDKLTPEQKEINKDFSNVISYIRDVIDKQKLDGALTGKYNATLAAKVLGLTDKTETTLTGKDGGPIETNNSFTVTVVRGLRESPSASEQEIADDIANELS